MPRWKELPETLDQRARQLVVQLRRLKDRSGLSLASLGRKTAYSRSSWERYLNGRALPPRQAVEELARLGGADPTRLLVLRELAEDARPQPRPDRAAAPEHPAHPECPGRPAPPGRPGESAQPERPTPAGEPVRREPDEPDLSESSGEPAPPERPGETRSSRENTPEQPGRPGEPAGPGMVAQPWTTMPPGSAQPSADGDGRGPEPTVPAAEPDAAPSGRTGDAGAPGRPGGPTAVRARSSRTPLAVGAVAAALAAVATAVLFTAAPWQDDGPAGTGASAAGEDPEPPRAGTDAHQGAFVYEPGRTYPCAFRRVGGSLGAGHSTTDTTVIQMSSTGWDVVEAQCLLRRRGFRPGEVDGVYGDLTARAVKRAQDRSGLVVDGKIGPHTWEVLRK